MFFYYLLIILILVLLIAGLIKLINDLIYILSHIKLLAHFFRNPLKTKSLVQFFLIFILICLLGLEIWGFPQMIHSGGCSGSEPRPALKKSVSAINQAIQVNYVKEQKLDMDSVEDFSQMFGRRLNVMSANFDFPDYILQDGTKRQHEKMKFTPVNIREYNLKEYIDKPMFMTADGILFIIEKFKPGCEFVDEENPDNSDCIIVIDVNGYKKPNEMTTDAKVPKDRYKIFVYGNVPKAIPLIESHQRIMYDGKTSKEIQEERNGRK